MKRTPFPTATPSRSARAGLERTLKRPQDFVQFLHSPVLVKLYRPRDGAKEFPGILEAYEDGRITISMGQTTYTFEQAEVALVRLRITF